MDKARVNKVVLTVLGDHYDELDDYIKGYITETIMEFSEDDGTLNDMVGPLLLDADIGDEDEVLELCEQMEKKLFGDMDITEIKTDTSAKLLAAPVKIGKTLQDVEAEMSIFEYIPNYEKARRGAKISYVNREEEAHARKVKREARKRAQLRRQEVSKPVKRDKAVKRTRKQMVNSRGKPKDFQLENFDISIAGRTLVVDGDLNIAFGRRYGFVGRNGAGKTTLLRHIAGREIHGIPDHMLILHVEQEAVGDDTPVLDFVLAADEERDYLLREEQRLLKEMEEYEKEVKQNKLNATPAAEREASARDKRLQEVYEELQLIDADGAESRAATILVGLGFSAEQQQRPTKEFSGGWRMRMALSRALFCQPDLLLLDEPTNMLDIGAVMWLKDYLTSWPTTIIVVSHDRGFLDDVATDIIHLNASKKLVHYKGAYEVFVKTRLEKIRHQKKAMEAQEKHRKHVQKFVDRFRYSAARAALVQSRIKMLSKMDVIPALIDDPTCSFSFPEAAYLNPPIIQFAGVSFGYNSGGNEKNIFDSVHLDFDMNSRVALVGANGTGKTTLLKLITGQLEANAGTLFRHNRLKFAIFSQHHVDQLDMEQSALEFFATNWPGKEPREYRSHLGRYGLSGDLALQPIDTLSGGQKSRVVFAIMGWMNPHFLILDEPTNHLDVETVDVLANALNDFTGGIVLVTHDERLIKLVCDEIWIVGDKTVKSFDGDFEDYKKLVLKDYRI